MYAKKPPIFQEAAKSLIINRSENESHDGAGIED